MVGHRVVALVGSAGGLQAMFTVLGALPPGFGGSVIVLLHQSPERPSALAELLDRRCALDVRDARDGDVLAPGRAYVVPPGRHLLLRDGDEVVLVQSGPAPPSRPSADLLLATMATALGPRAVAVVLSGGGHDGATGADAVHRLGGTVFTTDERTSAFFSMPEASIRRDGTVDRVLPVEQIGPAIVALVANHAP